MIERDLKRFREIVRGRVRKNLRKYMGKKEMIGRKGGKPVSIPVPNIQIPRFRFGHKDTGGVGQGEGEKGTPIGRDPNQGGKDKAGSLPGKHILEVEVTMEELAQILGEELELPDIEPRGKENIESKVDHYTDIHKVGPESLRHFKRTYKEALKRQIMLGDYNPDNPCVIPVKEDKRYRSWKSEYEPDSNAVIIYMMDVSGSMGRKKKDLVRLTSFWLDTWLRYQYQKVEVRYIIHDAEAHEVDEHTFYHTRVSGGTKISSAYKLCLQLIAGKYNPADWNIYPFHFSDGDNWGDDDDSCIDILIEHVLPLANLFCYGEVRYFTKSLTRFSSRLNDLAEERDNMIMAQINEKDEVYDAIRTFLGKGR